MENEFNPHEVIACVRHERNVRRKRSTFEKSKLIKYKSELISLFNVGASYRDMAFWLRKNKRVKIDHSNIKRYLDKTFAFAEDN